MRGGCRSVALLLLACAACRGGGGRPGLDTATLAARASRMDSLLQVGPDSGAGADTAVLARWIMPSALSEISGLALTPDGRLLAHGDERATVYELDFRRGTIVKQFHLGASPVAGDFEGIALGGGRLYLMTSNGKIYESFEGNDGEHVSYTIHDTRLGHECELEGLAFDPDRQQLLLPCKHVHQKKYDDDVVIYRYAVHGPRRDQLQALTIPQKTIARGQDWKEFHPSAIEVVPASGDYLLVSALEDAMVLVTPTGAVRWVRPLPPGHEQCEGVTVTPGGLLILSDEARRLPAIVAVYRFPAASPAPAGGSH